MDIQHYVARLMIDGSVVVPDVLSPRELAEMDAAFERRANEIGKRWMGWDDICLVPEFARYIAHPKLMAVVEGFTKQLGYEAVFANSSGCRDVFDPAKPEKMLEKGFDLRTATVGWHDDVMGMKNPNSDILQTTLTTLLYLDDTFADNGAYCTAIGSHHLAGATFDKKPILAKPDFVLQQCELRPLPLKAGSVILHRGHNWHGVIPCKQRRRLVLQTFSTPEHYDLQVGHTQLSDATIALIPQSQHKYLTSYQTA